MCADLILASSSLTLLYDTTKFISHVNFSLLPLPMHTHTVQQGHIATIITYHSCATNARFAYCFHTLLLLCLCVWLDWRDFNTTMKQDHWRQSGDVCKNACGTCKHCLNDTHQKPKALFNNNAVKSCSGVLTLKVSGITHRISSPSKQITVSVSHSSPPDKFTLSAVLSENIQEMKTSSCPLNIPPIRYLKDIFFNGVGVFVIQQKKKTCGHWSLFLKS